MVIKPRCFQWMVNKAGEKKSVSKEVGLRLGQSSEFSLLVGTIALESGLISKLSNNLIQATTILTFIASSYIVVIKYPTPMSLTEKMRKD